MCHAHGLSPPALRSNTPYQSLILPWPTNCPPSSAPLPLGLGTAVLWYFVPFPATLWPRQLSAPSGGGARTECTPGRPHGAWRESVALCLPHTPCPPHQGILHALRLPSSHHRRGGRASFCLALVAWRTTSAHTHGKRPPSRPFISSYGCIPYEGSVLSVCGRVHPSVFRAPP